MKKFKNSCDAIIAPWLQNLIAELYLSKFGFDTIYCKESEIQTRKPRGFMIASWINIPKLNVNCAIQWSCTS